MAASLLPTLHELVNRIRSHSISDQDNPIPDSDSIYKELAGDLSENSDRLLFMLRILNEAHSIFILKLVEPDLTHNVKGLDGYVVAEEGILGTVLINRSHHLERIYEKQFKTYKGKSGIIRDLFPQIRQYKNTPIGKAMNEVVMLEQFLSLMKATPEQFTTEWKENKLNELLPEITGKKHESAVTTEYAEDMDVDAPATEVDAAGETREVHQQVSGPPRRAIDMPEYLEIEEMNLSGKWGETVARYGVQFLVRIHLRKNEFAEVKKLIRMKRIAREKDLRYIRDTIRNMESRLDMLSPLYRYRQEIAELRRLAQFKLNQIIVARQTLVQKSLGGEMPPDADDRRQSQPSTDDIADTLD